MKYIILDRDGLEYPVIFSILDSHAAVRNKFHADKIVSAGFITLTGSGVSTFGGSVTLDINSRLEDKAVIEKCFARQI